MKELNDMEKFLITLMRGYTKGSSERSVRSEQTSNVKAKKNSAKVDFEDFIMVGMFCK